MSGFRTKRLIVFLLKLKTKSMRLPLLLILLPLLALTTDAYIYGRNLRNRSRWVKILWWSVTAVVLVAVFVAVLFQFKFRGTIDINVAMWIFYGFFLVYMPKWFYSICSLFDYLPRLWHKRRGSWGHFVGLALSFYVMGSMLYGAFYARQHPVYNYRTITFDRLPEAFDGYRIVQFSDLHIETLGSAGRYLPRWVADIDSLHPDLIVFTGDLVNRQGGELPRYMPELSRLSATDGVYSVLGNHDYGDYYHWSSPAEQEKTLQQLIADEGRMGWHMLNNRSVWLHRGNDSIALIGVENWGMPPFPQYGRLAEAYPALNDSTFKILLSHNPLHWRHEVIPQSNIDLTLSGHTHAMQLKLGWKGFEYSLAEPMYPEWSGLYTAPDGRHKLYVNEGMGCVFLPMRIGARPEITVITLKKEP